MMPQLIDKLAKDLIRYNAKNLVWDPLIEKKRANQLDGLPFLSMMIIGGKILEEICRQTISVAIMDGFQRVLSALSLAQGLRARG